MKNKWIAMALIPIWLAAILPGCVGYRLGSTLPPDVKSIFVRLFLNKSNEPLIETEATNATIAELQRDGTLKIARSEDADVTLECTLTSVTLAPLRYQSTGDRAKPSEYRLTLECTYVLKRTGSKRVMDVGDVIGEATFLFSGNLATAKRSAIPTASEDLAKRIVEKVVEVW